VDNLLNDPTVQGVVVTMRDVSEQKSLEEELKHQAFHDALTGLPNRALFVDRIDHALARSARVHSTPAVLFIDLDDFKLVNDGLGHGAGDEILVAVAQRLAATVRAGDTLARFGGDEFAVLVEDADVACLLAERILADLGTPFTVSDAEILIRASIGVAVSESSGQHGSELIQAADVAMYAAKGRGKGRYEIYHRRLQTAITERLEWTAELHRAVDEDQFTLHYQPIVRIDGEAVVGVEALLRWNHPARGLLAPKDFVSLTEETGLIVPIGRWALRQACCDAARWQTLTARPFRISVNISPRQFQTNTLTEDVKSALEDWGLDPANLVLEITESLLVQDTDAVIAQMLELKLLGLSFAIDDFGTGFSSLGYLRRFPIDVLKIDKSFVEDIGRSAQGGVLADAVVGLSKSLGLTTVAEGVETVEQLEGLRAMGCDFAQGFYFARPMTAQEIEQTLLLAAST
jgi:diguanylate cyclase (GGDEF)-like protein